MDGFKNIEIKNFRGIDHLKIDVFSQEHLLGVLGDMPHLLMANTRYKNIAL